ncbi:MscS family membrane protein [Dysgonomonadaceae bacterium PH5-43]|nr:MscS family membrane protein [Dysgonomonadaceae bacterium PH5-43]
MLENIFLGNTVEDWIISISIVLWTALLAKLISLFNKKVVLPITVKTKTNLDNILYEAIGSPIVFGIALIGLWIALQRLNTTVQFEGVINIAYKILVTINITWFFARLFDSALNYYMNGDLEDGKKAKKHNHKMIPIVRRSIHTVVWVIGIITALDNIADITALLGTLGIGGIAFALAAQDTIKNIFGAFTLLTDRPFNIGDIVRIDSYEGTIVDIGMRSTKMRNYDKRLITFPNYKIADASIVNISAEPMRRVTLKIGLTYDTTPEKMNEALAILRNVPNNVEFVNAKNLTAHFSEFADSALIITFVYNIEKKGDIKNTTSNVNLEILQSFNSAGLNFAFPTQTLIFEGDKN